MEDVEVEDRRSSDLSEMFLTKAKDELGETDELREEYVALIKEWIENCSYPKLDDISIHWFLRSCKFDVNKCKTRIENFYSFRSKVPEWYTDRDPLLPELIDILNLGTLLPLPGRDDEGKKIVLIRAAIHNPYQHKQDDVYKVMNMILELMCAEDERTSITGVSAIVDLSGIGFGHARQMTPSAIKKLVNSWQDVNPIRTKAMHYVNTPLNIHVVMNVFKAFMKEKLRRRLHLHRGDSRKVLTTLIPCDILPKEYGGTGPSVDALISEWRDRTLAYRDWFMKTDNHGPFSFYEHPTS